GGVAQSEISADGAVRAQSREVAEIAVQEIVAVHVLTCGAVTKALQRIDKADGTTCNGLDLLVDPLIEQVGPLAHIAPVIVSLTIGKGLDVDGKLRRLPDHGDLHTELFQLLDGIAQV